MLREEWNPCVCVRCDGSVPGNYAYNYVIPRLSLSLIGKVHFGSHPPPANPAGSPVFPLISTVPPVLSYMDGFDHMVAKIQIPPYIYTYTSLLILHFTYTMMWLSGRQENQRKKQTLGHLHLTSTLSACSEREAFVVGGTAKRK